MENEKQAPHVGAELAAARTRKGLSLEEVSHRTKIHVLTLLAIEHDDKSTLPPNVFVRGFLRAYAREVGCDPEDIVRRYQPPSQDCTPPADAPDSLPASGAVKKSKEASRVTRIAVDASPARGWVGTLATVLVLVAAYWAMTHSASLFRLTRARAPITVAEAAPQPEVSPRPEIGTVGVADADVPDVAVTNAPAAGVRVEGTSRGPCWVTATADGERVIYRLLNDGERTQIEAKDEVVLRLGDPANFDFTINGKPARRLGKAGEPVTVTVTTKNIEQFLGN